MDRLELLADLAGDLVYNAVGPASEDRWGCLYWIVALGLVAAGIGAILVHLA